jgi:hypothetical protein
LGSLTALLPVVTFLVLPLTLTVLVTRIGGVVCGRVSLIVVIVIALATVVIVVVVVVFVVVVVVVIRRIWWRRWWPRILAAPQEAADPVHQPTYKSSVVVRHGFFFIDD